LPDPLTTAEPTVTPAVPTQQILLTATCNFDTGLCPLWDGRAGVTADGEWESAYENVTTGVWAPLEGPKNGKINTKGIVAKLTLLIKNSFNNTSCTKLLPFLCR
jgi:hypothetical protein